MHEQELNGASRSMLNLIDELGKTHKFIVLSPIYEGPVIDELKRRNITIIFHPIKRWVRFRPQNKVRWFLTRIKWYIYNRFYNYFAVNKIIKAVEPYQIDLIHTNVSVINIGALLSRKMKVPHIWHVREFGKEDFGFLPLCSERHFYREMDKGADVIVTVSNALKKKYEPHISRAKLTTVYNGVGVENYTGKKTYEKKDKCRFLISGALVKGKGQDVAIKAVNELLKRGIDGFELYIAGKGDEAALKNMPEYNENYVFFLGQVQDMISLRKKMDVELVCSASEAFGRVTVEAMMAGNPVIGSASGGTPELIESGTTGYLFEKGNYIELADKMEHLIRENDEIELLGTQAQKTAVEKYTITSCAQNIDKLYDSLVKGEKHG